MNTKGIFGFFVAIIGLVVLLGLTIPVVSAAQCDPGQRFACVNEVVVSGIEFDDFDPTPTAGVTAGEVIPVRVVFTASDNLTNGFEDDVRVLARIHGEAGLSEVTGKFDVLQGNTYSKLLNVELPYDIDPSEKYVLEINVESNSGEAEPVLIKLEIQRSDDEMEILFVETVNEVRAGENLLIEFAVKNRGRDEAEDTRVKASIMELGISKSVFLGDLSPEDQSHPDKEDSVAGRIFLQIPSNAVAGLYTIELEAFNREAVTTTTKRIVVSGSGEDSRVLSSSTSKSFGVGEEEFYSVTIVNAGNRIAVYEVVVENPSGLSVTAEESVVAVPAGTSRTVRLSAMANSEGTYNFAVNINSEDGQLVKRENFVANATGKTTATGSAAVVLTIILAIIFVVLLIVLIVLLTRKPEKQDELSESYY